MTGISPAFVRTRHRHSDNGCHRFVGKVSETPDRALARKTRRHQGAGGDGEANPGGATLAVPRARSGKTGENSESRPRPRRTGTAPAGNRRRTGAGPTRDRREGDISPARTRHRALTGGRAKTGSRFPTEPLPQRRQACPAVAGHEGRGKGSLHGDLGRAANTEGNDREGGVCERQQTDGRREPCSS